MDRVITELRLALPPVFAGRSIDELTGGAIHWPTIQNLRSARKIPDECFCRAGSRVLVIRDPFLDWWSTTLTEARTPPLRHALRGRRRIEKPERLIDELPVAE
jgi:hypothetical protein